MRSTERAPSGGTRVTILGAVALLLAGVAAAMIVDDREPEPGRARQTDRAVSAPADAAATAASPAEAPEKAGAAKAPEGGYIAYIDPDTGQLIPKPPPDDPNILRLSAASVRALSRSHEDVYEEALPNGSFKLHLNGRFRSAMFATVAPDGTLRSGHAEVLRPRVEPEPEEPSEQAEQSPKAGKSTHDH